MSEERRAVSSNIPVPDPSVITTEQIERAKVELRHEMAFSITALREMVVTRLDAMDQAAKLLDINVNRVPTLLDRETSRLTDLISEKFTGLRVQVEEKFGGIQTQFRERDIRTDQDKIAASTAVNAALQAQKEAAAATNESNAAAIAKSEGNTTKQLDGMSALFQQSTADLRQQIADIKGRIDKGEGVQRGGTEDRNTQRSDAMAAWGAVGGIVSIISAIIAAIAIIVVLSHSFTAQPTTAYYPNGQPTVNAPVVVPVTPQK